MGSGIACHFANIGVEVLLLDIVPRELTEAETKRIDIRKYSCSQSIGE
jgi:3-hydroxyacyl-CoA dehydrogenase